MLIFLLMVLFVFLATDEAFVEIVLGPIMVLGGFGLLFAFLL